MKGTYGEIWETLNVGVFFQIQLLKQILDIIIPMWPY